VEVDGRGRAAVAARERPVRPQHVEVDVQPQRAVESLHEDDAARARVGDASVPARR
jgi:hypothetical protein